MRAYRGIDGHVGSVRSTNATGSGSAFAAACIPVPSASTRVLGVLVRYLGPDDHRLARLRYLVTGP
ncbi:hypothetical protein BH23ACT2_BH23ACT2_00050 [soil metagenome]